MPNKRTADRVGNNLGIIPYGSSNADHVCRNKMLQTVDQYLSSTQYDHLRAWDFKTEAGECCPIRERKPILIHPIPRLFTDRLASKLLGDATFPKITIEEDPDTEEFIKLIMKNSWFKAKLLQASKFYISHGAVFVRYKLVQGNINLESFNPNYCYPEFDEEGNLERIEIKYVYTDENDRDEAGKPKKKWWKLELNKIADILYDNPEYKPGSEPSFQVEKSNEHNLGFVQGEWIRNVDLNNTVDGFSFVEEITDFCDSFNYSLSQSDKAVSYGQEQQAWIKGLKDTEVEELVKSSSTAWNLGKEGEVGFMEAGMTGFEAAQKLREELSQGLQQIMRVILLNPEKIAGHAQSAKAMEVLHGPMVEIIHELRPNMEKGIVQLLQKMVATLLIYNAQGFELAITIPPGYQPLTMDINTVWPPVFEPTIQDIAEVVRVASQAASSNIISRESATRYVAKFFGIEDIEGEQNKINTQPQFGGFF